MNPREFARDSGFDLTIALTHCFDPVFFENVVLHDLRIGGSGSIVIIADREEVRSAIANSQLPLEHLGRQYMLSPATHSSGEFHPKLMLRLGREEGQVLVGSGNLTCGGWGWNRELGTSWKIGPAHDDHGHWILPLLADIEVWCSGEREREAIAQAKLIPWITNLRSKSFDMQPPLLYSRIGSTLAQQLAVRWRGRQFNKLFVATRTSDDRGGMLRWAHDTFGVTKVILAGTPSVLSLEPKYLENLPCDVRLKAYEENVLNAKFYWFDGPDGPAAVFGSANCSAAAWLLDPRNGGNVETLVCFDQPEKYGFSEVLSLFSGRTAEPASVLTKKKNMEDSVDDGADEVLYRITTLDWNAQFSIVSFMISPPPPENSKVELVINRHRAMARSVESARGRYQSQYSDGFEPGTLLGRAIIKTKGKQYITSERWVDCLIELERSRIATRTFAPLLGLEQEQDSTGQRKLVKAIHLIIQTLFSDAGYFPDPTVFSMHRLEGESNNKAGPAPTLDPLEVFSDLSELKQKSRVRTKSQGARTWEISGILSLLFSSRSRDHIEPAANQIESDHDYPQHARRRSKQRNFDPLDERYVERLANQVSQALDQLSSPHFADNCTAVQFVQATAFPLAVAELGRVRGWVSREQAEQWVIRVFATLFRGCGHGTGLLQKVKNRYQDSDKTDVFEMAVGDGSLWAALVASLVNSRWVGAGAEFEKVLAIRELFREPSLLKTANAALLLRYANALRLNDATATLTIHAPLIVKHLERLESELDPHWNFHLQAGAGSVMPVHRGDLLWRRGVGWAFGIGRGLATDRDAVRLRGQNTQVMKGYYLNVTKLAKRVQSIDQLIADLLLKSLSIQAR